VPRATVASMTTPEPDERPVWLIPAAEWAQMHAATPPPDTSPLDDTEIEELRRRMDAPGGAHLALTPREHRAWYRQLRIIRTPDRVRAVIRQVNADSTHSTAEGQDYAAGILDAIAWATGGRREGPVTGEAPDADVPRTGELLREMRAALDVLHRERDCTRPPAYVTGIEATMGWLVATVDDPPW